MIRKSIHGLVIATSLLSASALLAQDLTVNLVNEPSTLDPHQQWNPDSYYVYRNVFDNVVTRDDAGEIVPQIATAWEQVSETEMVLTIRDDVTFHDGEPLTAEDVAFSVQRITNPDFGSPQLGQFNQITGAEVTGDSEVTLTTDGAYPVLLAQLVKLSVVPQARRRGSRGRGLQRGPGRLWPLCLRGVEPRGRGDTDPQRRLLGRGRPVRDGVLRGGARRLDPGGQPACRHG